MSGADAVIWHDLECGLYRADLGFWRRLAAESGDPILDLGAGTGRVSLELAGAGHRVVALDIDADLLAALASRAATRGDGSSERIVTVQADARSFALQQRFALCVVPMQTIQLLSGSAGRLACLTAVAAHLVPGGVAAISIAPTFEEFVWSDGDDLPLPDIVERDGTVYASQPTAVRAEGDTVMLERRREVIDPRGGRAVSEDRIALDIVSAATLIAEGRRVGLTSVGTHTVAPTDEHVGSLVVIFRA